MGEHTFCVWVSGEPARVVRAIGRSLASSLAHQLPVEEVGPDWAGAGGAAPVAPAVVLVTGPPDQPCRESVRAAVRQVVEVRVGGARHDADIHVPGDPARAGESVRAVLRRLAVLGWCDDLDEYSADDEAVVSGRLRNFGYR